MAGLQWLTIDGHLFQDRVDSSDDSEGDMNGEPQEQTGRGNGSKDSEKQQQNGELSRNQERMRGQKTQPRKQNELTKRQNEKPSEIKNSKQQRRQNTHRIVNYINATEEREKESLYGHDEKIDRRPWPC